MGIYVSRGAVTGHGVLVATLNIWLTNVIVFALVQPDHSRDVLTHFHNKQRNHCWWNSTCSSACVV